MKHKVGDKVRITADTSSHGCGIGDVVVVTLVYDDYDEYRGGVGWYFGEDECEAYDEPTFTHPKDAPEGHKWVTLSGDPVEQVSVCDVVLGSNTVYVKDLELHIGPLKDAPAFDKLVAKAAGRVMEVLKDE